MNHENFNPLTSCIDEVKRRASLTLGITFEKDVTLRGTNYHNVIVPACPVTSYVKLSSEPICHWDVLNDLREMGISLNSAIQTGEVLHCEFSHFGKTLKSVGSSMSENIFRIFLYHKTNPISEAQLTVLDPESTFVAA